jgi:TBC1 domain family protein 5
VDFDRLREATKSLDGQNATGATLRSLCWKAFLVFGDTRDFTGWSQILKLLRGIYGAYQDRYLQYIKHPEQLDSTLDPLADEADVINPKLS